MSAPHSTAPRGQATVELALGTLLIIGIVTFGLHLAEVTFLSLKVEEATASALWDTTSRKMHAIPGVFYDANQAPFRDTAGRLPGPRAQALYQNFDGRTSKAGSGTSITQVFTQGQGLTVTCAPSRVGPAISFRGASGVYVGPAGGALDGMSCSASASLASWNAPKRFLDKQGSLWGFDATAAKWDWQTLKVCGQGRAVSGTCAGKIAIMYDDFGLSGPPESAAEPLNSGQGLPYYNATNQVFARYGRAQGNAASQLAIYTANVSPCDENAFYMSFTGEERNFQQSGISGDWFTQDPVPTSFPLNFLGTGCFLGQGC